MPEPTAPTARYPKLGGPAWEGDRAGSIGKEGPEGGSLIESPAHELHYLAGPPDEAQAVYGGIGAHGQRLGRPAGPLSDPAADEINNSADRGTGRVSRFENGFISWDGATWIVPDIRTTTPHSTGSVGSAEAGGHHHARPIAGLAIILTVVSASVIPDKGSQPRHPPGVVLPGHPGAGFSAYDQVPAVGRGLDTAVTHRPGSQRRHSRTLVARNVGGGCRTRPRRCSKAVVGWIGFGP
jgi:hypothetical protein